MLTVDLVRARPRGGELKLTELQGRAKVRAKQLAGVFLSLAEDHLGETREAFDEACQAVLINPKERKLALGMRKLVEDLCLFAADDSVDSRELRREVFLLATRRRKELADGEVFDRNAVLAEVALARGGGEAPEALLEGLYNDMREAHILREVPPITAEALVERYDLAQAQAVLLKATRVVAEISCKNPATYRHIFGKLKFRRLLYTIEKRGKSGYRICLDGPFSLFSSVTKYGLQLALMLPALQLCDSWSLEADLLWGKERRKLRFALSGKRPRRGGEPDPGELDGELPEEVRSLMTQLEKKDYGWVATPSQEILDLPGLGLCVPDLRFDHLSSGTVVYLEVLGFWSREAVWRRVELVEGGLPQKILFAVPKRLRVSEEVLDGELPGALYVYKGKMNTKAIVERLDAMIPTEAVGEQPTLF